MVTVNEVVDKEKELFEALEKLSTSGEMYLDIAAKARWNGWVESYYAARRVYLNATRKVVEAYNDYKAAPNDTEEQKPT